MAKQDIPFELFWKWYYPEKNPPLARVAEKDYDSHLDEFIGKVYNITIDDILSLSEEELLFVPAEWLYQWTWCHAESNNPISPVEFFRLVEAKRGKYKILDIALLRALQSFIKTHKHFTARELQQALKITYDSFLGVVLWLVHSGKVQYREKQYWVVG